MPDKKPPRLKEETDLIDGLDTRGDGRGIGPTLGPDVSIEAERREIERNAREKKEP